MLSRLAQVYTRASQGIRAPAVSVEVHLSAGLPCLNIVGLPEAAVRESKDRVRSALVNSGYEFPDGRITVNLAPADLPIALGILVASGQLPEAVLENREFIGELALSGQLRPVKAILPASIACQKKNRELILAKPNADIAAVVHGAHITGVQSLLEICAYLNNKIQISPTITKTIDTSVNYPDLSDVHGQEQAKRALIIAAAGGHHLVFFGAPGTGKTMLASSLPGILPPLSESEALEVAAIHSLASSNATPLWKQRPFRTPHHSSSSVSMVGGGSLPKPGEVSYAHHGVLFLDEMPEFQRQALEILREPLESGEVVITRAKGQETYPAKFQLIGAMNPCPCGYLGDTRRHCRCTPDQIARYRNKLSGPLLDRIDLQIEVPSQNIQVLINDIPKNHETTSICSTRIRKNVIQVRQQQLTRQGKINAQLSPQELFMVCKLAVEEKDFLIQAADRLHISARGLHRVLRVARTIADLAESEAVLKKHLAEAFQYRQLDRQAQA